jgi:plastocyanin
MRMRALILALPFLMGAVACSDGAGNATGDINMLNGHKFSPVDFTVKAGETITFSNASTEFHTVTAYQDSLPEGAAYFSSGGATSEEEARGNVSAGLIKAGDTFTLTLSTPGTYKYFCIPHESAGMKGTIVVGGK